MYSASATYNCFETVSFETPIYHEMKVIYWDFPMTARIGLREGEGDFFLNNFF